MAFCWRHWRGLVGILVVEEADNLDSMKKSTIIGGNKYYLDYEHGCSTTALEDCCWRNGELNEWLPWDTALS